MDSNEKNRMADLLREIRTDGGTKEASKISWMYKGPGDLVDKEEYLLGRSVDKAFEASRGEPVFGDANQSNIPKKLLSQSGGDSHRQVDLDNKIHEDPLYAIRQKEIEARKKLLSNPVKLKQIKEMIARKNEAKQAKELKKKKKKRKDAAIDDLILERLNDLKKSKGFDNLDDILNSETSSSDEKHRRKTKKKKASKHHSSDKSDDSDSSSYRKHRRKKTKKKTSKYESSEESDSEDSKGPDKVKARNKRSKEKKEKEHGRSEDSRRQHERSLSERMRYNEGGRRQKGDSDDDSKNKRQRLFGLMRRDGSRPEPSVDAPVPAKRYEKKVEPVARYERGSHRVGKVEMSEAEQKAALAAMMTDAKARKVDRESNLTRHRKEKKKEDRMQEYDEQFMRKQMSAMTSQGTMADRIKSNINNIQRSNRSMDSHFARK